LDESHGVLLVGLAGTAFSVPSPSVPNEGPRFRHFPPEPSLAALSGAQLVGDADGVTYGLRLLEHGEHHVGDISPRDDQAVAHVAVYRSSVCAGERSVDEPRWPDRGPVQTAAAQQVFHGGEVDVVAAKDSPDQRA